VVLSSSSSLPLAASIKTLAGVRAGIGTWAWPGWSAVSRVSARTSFWPTLIESQHWPINQLHDESNQVKLRRDVVLFVIMQRSGYFHC
jgi:hypothetical protein